MSSLLPNNDPGVNVVVTKEEFNLFHNIDRILFYRFVVGLGRDPSQTTHVMAFIIWLEKFTRNFRMVANLLQWPNSLLADLADEAILALTCIESHQFPYPGGTSDQHLGLLLPLIQKITRSTVNLMYFHEKRIDIIPGITRILNDVCIRAFNDIIQQVHYHRAVKEHQRPTPAQAQAPAPAPFYGPMPPPPNSFVQPLFYYSPVVPDNVAYMPQPPMMVSHPQWHEGSSSSSRVLAGVGGSGSGSLLGPYVINKDEFNQEFHEILASFKISDDAERRDVLAPDDRTIFMTFSKGYPISENEVREFFSRRYGDVIESIFMQEVSEHEQPLYARLVLRAGAIHMLDGLLDGTSRMKFIINGKHVWVRRYLRKGNKSPTPDSQFGAGPSH
ncbi:hypothetical protein TanjilG_07626 [Lupinus angustifolius]|uniref:RRM domain-containing protein n=1 Tax=Lupinus angustifolius TaxID=3871 RepID=A0A1J7GLL2_LUPAN|nr:PREDICTED: uncharacterized protein LOC109342036 [Lupinus angustifolius]OIV89002.1 hypothetical protein TanjilG_07626 [Lupinus angustifolius]